MLLTFPSPAQVTILKPASLLTDTVDVISPSVFEDDAPPAFQHHATLVSLPPLVTPVAPTLNPFS